MTTLTHEPTAAELRLSLERVIHDIQTRMQGLIANADILFRDCESESPSLREAAKEVLDNAWALETLVHTAGDHVQPYFFEPLRLEDFIRDAVNIYRHEAKRRWIQIKWQLGKQGLKPPYALADPLVSVSRIHLRHAVNNLVHNAVKFSLNGNSAQANIVEIAGYPEGDYYCLRISNYGYGVLPEEITSGTLFEEHYQGKLAREHCRTGSGKGLYFVKQVIDQHQGRIEVESTLADVRDDIPRYSTRFLILLPFRRNEDK